MSEAGGTGTSAVRIRAAEPPDAAALLALKHRLDRESHFICSNPMNAPAPPRRSLAN